MLLVPQQSHPDQLYCIKDPSEFHVVKTFGEKAALLADTQVLLTVFFLNSEQPTICNRLQIFFL